MQRIAALASNLEQWRGLAKAGSETLARQAQVDPGRLAAIGYCFGVGPTARNSSRAAAPTSGPWSGFTAVSLRARGEARNIKGKVLALLGADDPLIPSEPGSPGRRR